MSRITPSLQSLVFIATAVSLAGCASTRQRDVARVEPKIGNVATAPVFVPSGGTPVAAAPAPPTEFVTAPVQAPAAQVPFTPAPRGVAPLPAGPPAASAPPLVMAAPLATGSAFQPAAGPAPTSPVPVAPGPQQVPSQPQGAAQPTSNLGAGFLSSNLSPALRLQPSQPALPVYGPGSDAPVPTTPAPPRPLRTPLPPDISATENIKTDELVKPAAATGEADPQATVVETPPVDEASEAKESVSPPATDAPPPTIPNELKETAGDAPQPIEPLPVEDD